jgi:hypothetical protein
MLLVFVIAMSVSIASDVRVLCFWCCLQQMRCRRMLSLGSQAASIEKKTCIMQWSGVILRCTSFTLVDIVICWTRFIVEFLLTTALMANSTGERLLWVLKVCIVLA